jgi:1-acyl-sn-glycerol-3-phosphate acyltransferase
MGRAARAASVARAAYHLRETASGDTLRYRLILAAVRLIVRALFRVRVDGLEHWPAAPFCIVLNHHNASDPLMVMAVVPAIPRITWFGPRVGVDEWARIPQYRLMAFMGGTIPIDPDKATLTSAVRAVRGVFAGGGVLGIFAEGHGYFRETRLEPFEDGAVAFAVGAGVPIVPAVVIGTTYLWWGKRLQVRFAPAIPTAIVRGADARAELTQRVRGAMEGMLPTHEPAGPETRRWKLLTDLFQGPEDVARRVADRGR